MQPQGLLFVHICQHAMCGLKMLRDQETCCGLPGKLYPPDTADASYDAGQTILMLAVALLIENAMIIVLRRHIFITVFGYDHLLY